MKKVLVSITTTSRTHSWKDKFIEVATLGLSEVALFVTALNDSEREECFLELQKLRTKHPFTIPFCHATSTMKETDYQFLIDHFGTERFNLHPLTEFPLAHKLSDELRERIFIENSGQNDLLTRADTLGFAGVCLDLSHLFDLKVLRPDLSAKMINFLDASKIGANHISGAFRAPYINRQGHPQCSTHHVSNDCQFDYLLGFPYRYFADFCAIELENSLSEQLKYKERIELIISAASIDLKKAA